MKKVVKAIAKKAKYEVRAFSREAVHQLGTGWGEEFARQIFGTPRRPRRSR